MASSETPVSASGTGASTATVASVESSTKVDRAVSFSIEGKTFDSAGKVRGEVGVSGTLVEGVTVAAGATVIGFGVDGLRI
jgi:hypothetical protein